MAKNGSSKTGTQVKNKNQNGLEEFPVEINKTHDLRLQGQHVSAKADHAVSFNDSINEIMPQSLTQNSIHYGEQSCKMASSSGNRQ